MKKIKMPTTHNVNVRIDVRFLATIYNYLHSRGVIIKHTSNIVQQGMQLKYLDIGVDERITDIQEAIEILKKADLIQSSRNETIFLDQKDKDVMDKIANRIKEKQDENKQKETITGS